MKVRIITGEPLTQNEVRHGWFSYSVDSIDHEITGELFYNKEKERFEHWHDDSTLIVWPYSI